MIWYTTENVRKMVSFCTCCERWQALRKLIELHTLVSSLNLLFNSYFLPNTKIYWSLKQKKLLKQIWGQYLTSGSIHPAFSLPKKSISAVIYAILCSCSFELQQRNTSHPWPTAFQTKCGDTIIYLLNASVKCFQH